MTIIQCLVAIALLLPGGMGDAHSAEKRRHRLDVYVTANGCASCIYTITHCMAPLGDEACELRVFVVARRKIEAAETMRTIQPTLACEFLSIDEARKRKIPSGNWVRLFRDGKMISEGRFEEARIRTAIFRYLDRKILSESGVRYHCAPLLSGYA